MGAVERWDPFFVVYLLCKSLLRDETIQVCLQFLSFLQAAAAFELQTSGLKSKDVVRRVKFEFLV